jgi:hypothetical protein
MSFDGVGRSLVLDVDSCTKIVSCRGSYSLLRVRQLDDPIPTTSVVSGKTSSVASLIHERGRRRLLEFQLSEYVQYTYPSPS